MKGSLRFLNSGLKTTPIASLCFCVSKDLPCVLHPDTVVVELDELDYDAHESLLPLYGWQDCPVLGVKDDSITFDTLRNCKERNYEDQFKVR